MEGLSQASWKRRGFELSLLQKRLHRFRVGDEQGAWLWAGTQGAGVSTAGGDERDCASK